MTIFYCLTLQTLKAGSPYLYPPGTGWLSYTTRPGFPFRRPLRLAGYEGGIRTRFHMGIPLPSYLPCCDDPSSVRLRVQIMKLDIRHV
jgi:hypothetical protein